MPRAMKDHKLRAVVMHQIPLITEPPITGPAQHEPQLLIGQSGAPPALKELLWNPRIFIVNMPIVVTEKTEQPSYNSHLLTVYAKLCPHGVPRSGVPTSMLVVDLGLEMAGDDPERRCAQERERERDRARHEDVSTPTRPLLLLLTLSEKTKTPLFVSLSWITHLSLPLPPSARVELVLTPAGDSRSLRKCWRAGSSRLTSD